MTEQESQIPDEFAKWRKARIEALQAGQPLPEAPSEESAGRARSLKESGIIWDHPWYPGISERHRAILHGVFQEAGVEMDEQLQKDAKRHPLVRAFLRVRDELGYTVDQIRGKLP